VLLSGGLFAYRSDKLNHYPEIMQRIVDRFSLLPEVESIALAGSHTTGQSISSSDLDLYVYPSIDLPAEKRLEIGLEFSPDAMVNDYWGPGLAWRDKTSGIDIDLMFFTTSWMEDLVLQPLEMFRAKTGFSTSFCHTIAVSEILFDRHNWLINLQQKAQQPYPVELAANIIKLNHPMLSEILFSYQTQIGSAVKRQDTVQIISRVSRFLESYFDILFALNQMLHPGEKRMMDILETKCKLLPQNMREDITLLLELAGTGNIRILETLRRIIDNLDELLGKA
jgi:predicted nucleotidyltransferase